MKNKGIKIGVVFLLLFALLSVAGCQYDDVVIVGAASGQPGPTSGQLRIGFTLFVSKGSSAQPSRDITINNLSLSADTSFTVTNTDTGDTTVLTGAVIDTDPTFTYVNFDEDDDILPASTRVSILIPYTLEPGNYKVTAVTGSVKYPSSSGTSVKDLDVARDGDGLNTTFTIAAPELTPTPEPTATPHRGTDGNTDCRAHRNAYCGTHSYANGRAHRNAHGGTDGHADSGAHGNPNRRTDGHAHSGTNGDTYGSSHSRTDCRADRNPKPDEPPQNGR